MRILILAATLGASVLATTAPAEAQYYGSRHREVRQEQRECARELRHARNRYEYRREQRECRREIARARAGYRDYDYRRDGRWRDRDRYDRYDRYDRRY
ncbi:MAG TPA: hypothetical protein VLG14_05725 [Sphingomonas sp.]|jgi:hypothetical protein|nr:hypothetical protein [Sphingomonas sp.]